MTVVQDTFGEGPERPISERREEVVTLLLVKGVLCFTNNIFAMILIFPKM